MIDYLLLVGIGSNKTQEATRVLIFLRDHLIVLLLNIFIKLLCKIPTYLYFFDVRKCCHPWWSLWFLTIWTHWSGLFGGHSITKICKNRIPNINVSEYTTPFVGRPRRRLVYPNSWLLCGLVYLSRTRIMSVITASDSIELDQSSVFTCDSWKIDHVTACRRANSWNSNGYLSQGRSSI